MLGTLKVPNGVASAKPPPRRSSSFCFGVAWQEAQPPMLNMVSPLARSTVRGGSGADTAGLGIVSA